MAGGLCFGIEVPAEVENNESLGLWGVSGFVGSTAQGADSCYWRWWEGALEVVEEEVKSVADTRETTVVLRAGGLRNDSIIRMRVLFAERAVGVILKPLQVRSRRRRHVLREITSATCGNVQMTSFSGCSHA